MLLVSCSLNGITRTSTNAVGANCDLFAFILSKSVNYVLGHFVNYVTTLYTLVALFFSGAYGMLPYRILVITVYAVQ